MPKVFANNALSPAETESLATNICGSDASPLWALVDAALVNVSHLHRLSERYGWQIAHGYAGSDLAAYGDAGVLLIALAHDAAERASQVAGLLLSTTPATALSWLSSAADLQTLQALCRYLAMASVMERKQPVHCRFADTRVLPVLLEQLDAAQVKRVQSVVSRWAWVDRQGRHALWEPATTPVGSADRHAHLHLTIDQFRAMRGHAESDGIFTLLWEQTPSLVPEGQLRGDFHAELVRILATASRFSVNDLKSRLQFVVLSLSCGDEFHTLPELQVTWEGVKSGLYLLVDKMPLWGNDTWRKLEYRRPEEQRGVLP